MALCARAPVCVCVGGGFMVFSLYWKAGNVSAAWRRWDWRKGTCMGRLFPAKLCVFASPDHLAAQGPTPRRFLKGHPMPLTREYHIFIYYMCTAPHAPLQDMSPENVPNITAALFMWCILPGFGAVAQAPTLVIERPLFVRWA